MDITLTDNSVQLSREEVVYLLALLKTDFILGLDPDPMGEMTKEQMKIGLIYSERALRARNLAAIDAKGELQISSTLFALIETCAYAEFSVAVHSFPAGAPSQQAFWHKRNDLIVRHTKPSTPLHLFDFVQEEKLAQDIFSVCDISKFSDAKYSEAKTTHKILAKIKEGSPDAEAIASILTKDGVEAETAKELGALLANDHTVIAIHAVHQKENDELEKNKLTILSGETSTWVSQDDDDNVVIKSIIETDLHNIFSELMM